MTVCGPRRGLIRQAEAGGCGDARDARSHREGAHRPVGGELRCRRHAVGSRDRRGRSTRGAEAATRPARRRREADGHAGHRLRGGVDHFRREARAVGGVDRRALRRASAHRRHRRRLTGGSRGLEHELRGVGAGLPAGVLLQVRRRGVHLEAVRARRLDDRGHIHARPRIGGDVDRGADDGTHRGPVRVVQPGLGPAGVCDGVQGIARTAARLREDPERGFRDRSAHAADVELEERQRFRRAGDVVQRGRRAEIRGRQVRLHVGIRAGKDRREHLRRLQQAGPGDTHGVPAARSRTPQDDRTARARSCDLRAHENLSRRAQRKPLTLRTRARHGETAMVLPRRDGARLGEATAVRGMGTSLDARTRVLQERAGHVARHRLGRRLARSRMRRDRQRRQCLAPGSLRERCGRDRRHAERRERGE